MGRPGDFKACPASKHGSGFLQPLVANMAPGSKRILASTQKGSVNELQQGQGAPHQGQAMSLNTSTLITGAAINHIK